ncbi:hypothetical protein AVEN_198578-1 [Araneus ventricosus]|uniref:Uncharacterized protein n=1 Tax=Araneus ventricosus TaxID=182803 RepID=A0A4Y2SYV6_ARAVE|nr:hypothetical protein AVEN_198578-1 [Araneus ventricosus]
MDLVILNRDQMTRLNLSWQPISKFLRHTNDRTFDVQFTVQQTQYMTDLHWNRVSYLEPSGPEAETLPLGHVGLRAESELDLDNLYISCGTLIHHTTHGRFFYRLGLRIV